MATASLGGSFVASVPLTSRLRQQYSQPSSAWARNSPQFWNSSLPYGGLHTVGCLLSAANAAGIKSSPSRSPPLPTECAASQQSQLPGLQQAEAAPEDVKQLQIHEATSEEYWAMAVGAAYCPLCLRIAVWLAVAEVLELIDMAGILQEWARKIKTYGMNRTRVSRSAQTKRLRLSMANRICTAWRSTRGSLLVLCTNGCGWTEFSVFACAAALTDTYIIKSNLSQHTFAMTRY